MGRAPAKRLAGPGPLVNPAQVMIDIDRLQAKRSLAAFVRLAWPIIEPNAYVHGWHIDALCEHLEAITDGVELPDGSIYNRLLVNIPPGTAKSMIVSVLWPCWEWGPAGKPHSRFLCVSHSQKLAVRDNMRSRRLIMSEWYQQRWPVKMVSDQNEKMKFENDQGGWREAAAAGSITGSRGDRVICLPYESRVLSSWGWLPIGEIVERRLPIKIAGTDGRTIEWQDIEAYETNPGRPLVRINDSLECTADHRVWVLGRGWVEAQNVVVGDTLYEINAGAVRELLGSGRQEQSQLGESGNSLSPLPREYARVTGAASGLDAVVVRSVGESARRVERTYNVRVAPFHNYFAGGVLVHNCDDPHSVEGAASEQMRQTTIEWFLEALPTRMNDPIRSAIVVIMQRLHEEDVSGVILEKKLGYDHLCLPMRATLWRRAFPTLLGYVDPRTEEGELLFPERFPEDVVRRDERAMGQYAVAGQFQQEPAPRGGGVIKREWWQAYIEPSYPPMSFIIASLDTAYTEKTENDPSALTVWGVTTGAAAMYASRYVAPGGRLREQEAETARFDEAARVKFRTGTQGGDLPRVILMDAWTDRLELHELVERVTKTCRKMKVDKLLIENKASGYSVAQEIRRLFGHENWAVQLLDPLGQDKLARLYSVQHLFEEGMIYAPDKAWADQVITQAAVFPKGKHDDLVDTTSMALRHLRELGLLTRAPEWTSDIYESMRHSGKPPGPIYPT